MSDLFALIGYEYKKIGKRKSTYITLGIILFLILFSGVGLIIGNTYLDGVKVSTAYADMVKDRGYGLNLSGRKVDKELIEEMQKGYSYVDTDTKYSITNEYELYARPYSSIRGIIGQVTKDYKHIDGERFYDIRKEMVKVKLAESNLSDKEVEKHLALDDKVDTPFTYSYTEGYDRFVTLNYTTGMLVAFGLAICLAPIFAGEYSSKMDGLLLSSKYGKNKLILAKLITGVSFTILIVLLSLGISLLECLLIYGFEGGNAPFQLWKVLSTYPLMIKDVIRILVVCTTLASVWVISITMFLSAKFKSPFGVIIVSTVIIFGGMFVQISSPNRLLIALENLLPSNMMVQWGVFSDYMFQIGSMNILPYHFIPIFCIVVTMICLYFAYRGFKNHQIS
jgi:ABC-type transport system involved in multi-copper enzyme maturation permease subunit